jgi:dienelactone hydrolase
MVILFRSILSILIIFLIAIASYADDKTQHIELLSKHFRLEKPEGKGPFPVVMLFPSCGGFDSKNLKPQFDRAQNLLGELGFVTLRIDYLAVRNARRCYSVNFEDAANDIGLVAEYLRQKDFVKKDAINVIGWGTGGAITLQALTETKNPKPAKVDAAIAYYPRCSSISIREWISKVPVLALFGAKDAVAPYSNCEKLFSNQSKPENVTVRIYEDAYMGFDNSDLPTELKKSWGTVGYNEAAAKSAWSEVTNFLKK